MGEHSKPCIGRARVGCDVTVRAAAIDLARSLRIDTNRAQTHDRKAFIHLRPRKIRPQSSSRTRPVAAPLQGKPSLAKAPSPSSLRRQTPKSRSRISMPCATAPNAPFAAKRTCDASPPALKAETQFPIHAPHLRNQMPDEPRSDHDVTNRLICHAAGCIKHAKRASDQTHDGLRFRHR